MKNLYWCVRYNKALRDVSDLDVRRCRMSGRYCIFCNLCIWPNLTEE